MTMPHSQKRIDGGKIPGPATVPSVIEVKVQTQLPNNKLSYWVAHGHFTTPPSNMSTLAGALFTNIGSAWNTQLAAFMATTTIYQSVWIRDMSNPLNPVFQGTGTAIPGTSASPAMPVNAAIVMTEQINARGRGAKGRIFLGGWATNADAGQGLIAGTLQTAINNFGTSLASALNGQGLTPCVAQVHRQAYVGITGTTHNDRPAGFVAVNNYTCQNLIWDTQRRRVQL